MAQIFDISQRRELERDVLKPILESEDFRKREVLEGVQQEDFETREYRDLYAELQAAVLLGKPFDPMTLSGGLALAFSEIISEGITLNGSWSAGVERLKVHRFDRFNYATSDLGNAERFQDLNGSEVRYDHTRGKWFLWDGHKWECDETEKVVELMAGTLRGIYADATNLESEAERKAMARWALSSESRAKISDALSIAQSLQRIRAKSTDFDHDPWKLNTQNGLLDLKKGTFLPHDHRAMCSKIAGTGYQESAECPWWQEFLETVFCRNAELIGFVQRAVGYSLTGVCDSQALFFAYGSGKNGKSTFFEILRLLFGDYYQKSPSDLLLLKRSESVPLDVARLRGVRLAVLAETECGRKLNEAKVKNLTGDDTIVARHLYGEFFQFQASHKVWMYGNHKPVVVGTDYGIWRRMHLIPFTVTIAEEKCRPMRELLSNAEREMPGILNWSLEGLEDWKLRDLDPPAVVREATQGYRDESDTVGQFLGECCTSAGEVPSNELHEAYQTWAGQGAMSSRMFLETVKDKGFLLRTGHGRKRIWQGLSLAKGEHGEDVR